VSSSLWVFSGHILNLPQLERVRLERAVRRLHSQGPRVVCELLAELAERGDAVPHILKRLDAYNALTPAMVRVAGADRFAPRPLRLVPEQ